MILLQTTRNEHEFDMSSNYNKFLYISVCYKPLVSFV